ncbi:hypothetical protein EDC04DRAFT_3090119 [Pisolithus marmoratus]|nr:hypothetical protein EDC04DRAFT_3090119 [Pisolithus marmoratus]
MQLSNLPHQQWPVTSMSASRLQRTITRVSLLTPLNYFSPALQWHHSMRRETWTCFCRHSRGRLLAVCHTSCGWAQVEFGAVDCQMISAIEYFRFIFREDFWDLTRKEGKEAFEDVFINFSHWVSMDENIIPEDGDNHFKVHTTSLAPHKHDAVLPLPTPLDKIIPTYFKENKPPYTAGRSSDQSALHEITCRVHCAIIGQEIDSTAVSLTPVGVFATCNRNGELQHFQALVFLASVPFDTSEEDIHELDPPPLYRSAHVELPPGCDRMELLVSWTQGPIARGEVGPIPQQLSPSAPIPVLCYPDLEVKYNVDPIGLVLFFLFNFLISGKIGM